MDVSLEIISTASAEFIIKAPSTLTPAEALQKARESGGLPDRPLTVRKQEPLSDGRVQYTVS